MTTEETTTETPEDRNAAVKTVFRYVCKGRRWNGKDITIVLVALNGDLRERHFPENKSSRHLRAGACYQVEVDLAADGVSAAGFYLARSRYDGKHDNAAEYELLDRAAQVEKMAAAREKRDTAANVETLKALRPIRRAYQATSYEGRLALEVVVLELMRRPFTAAEEIE